MYFDAAGDRRAPGNHLPIPQPSASPPPGAAADWTVPQDWERFTSKEHEVWDLLFARQESVMEDRAVAAFRSGLELLKLSKPGIPEFAELNTKLEARTGWTVVSVLGLVPDDVFFDHLRHRRFPAGNFIRRRDQLDYLEEPDVFHDVFGHVPLLADPLMARWVRRLGEFAPDAIANGTLPLLARLYWRTVEFGLAIENKRTRIYGAGILSSFTECAYALESHMVRRELFDMRQVLGTAYRSDALQDLYFVVSDWPALVADVEQRSWADLTQRVRA